MSTDVAQSTDRDEHRTQVASGHVQTIEPRPLSVDVSESAKSPDGPLDLYLPGKWSWGPGKSSTYW
jgi:hypothetical protein